MPVLLARRALLPALLAVALLGDAAAGAAAGGRARAPAGPEGVVRAAVAARAAGDADGFLALLAAGAAVDECGDLHTPPACQSPDQLRRVLLRAFAEGERLEVVAVGAAADGGGGVRLRLRDARAWYATAGLPAPEEEVVATVRDGRIVRWQRAPAPGWAPLAPTYAAAAQGATATAARAAATAIQPTMAARATRLAHDAQATAAAASGRRAPPPDSQGRGSPGASPWLVALGVCLAGVVLLSLAKRPPAAP